MISAHKSPETLSEWKTGGRGFQNKTKLLYHSHTFPSMFLIFGNSFSVRLYAKNVMTVTHLETSFKWFSPRLLMMNKYLVKGSSGVSTSKGSGKLGPISEVIPRREK